MAKRNLQFQTIRTEGAILPPDILRRIASLKVDGATPDAYHLPPISKLNEAISQSWTVLLNHWQAFQEAREKLSGEGETGTAVTNERWLLPLFNELDYGRLVTTKSPVIDERSYPIERFYNHTPIHLIGCKLPLDRRTKGARGAATASPHSMVQEFLNQSDDHVWAFLSNGLQLRILRDNVSLSRQTFVEFDLEAMMDGEVYADFALLWLLCHQSRVEADKPADCWLEKWSKLAREQGTRVLNELRLGVGNAIEALGRGFIGHPRNDQLREKLQSGALSKDEFYRQLLRIVYRLLFLFVAEDRELLHAADASKDGCDLYDTHYSTRRLRELAVKMRGSKHADLWHSLSLVFDALGKNEGCPQLGLIGLGSFLWRASSTADLLGPHQANGEAVLITNDDLLQGIRALAYVEQDRVLRMVDYRNLGSEELGSVYESLLELHPDMDVSGKSFSLMSAAGNERKTTGSYYTPDSLVQCLLDSALDPVVDERLKGKKGEEAEKVLLEIRVCDPASGSGHFLIAAAHRLARHLARARTGDAEPSPNDYQHALRDIIGRCIYGVDINPMAVELCKVSLWIEAIEPGKPLSFLDHHIQCGDSLLGTTPALLANGIPDDAFTAIEGDVKARVATLKKENKKERKDYKSGQGYLFSPTLKLGDLPAALSRINVASDDSLVDVNYKQHLYEQLMKGVEYRNARLLPDTWCAAFVWKKDDSDLGTLCPTERIFRSIEDNPHSINIHAKAEVERLATQYQLFHWHLAFPDVFRLSENGKNVDCEEAGWSGGFDVMLGNPPWEHTELKEKEFFATSRPDIADARTSAIRKRMISELTIEDPSLHASFADAKRRSAGSSHLIQSSGAFPLCGRGRTNTYGIFAELNTLLMSNAGRAGCIVPSGIATDDTYKHFFSSLVKRKSLSSLFDFENQGIFFPEVHRNYKFCLLTLSGCSSPASSGLFLFFGEKISDIGDGNLTFELSPEDIALFSPNTGNCPIFRSRCDAELAKSIYRRIPVLLNESCSHGNPWDISIRRVFNMGLPEVVDQCVQSSSADLDGSLPMYESKLMCGFDHRHATYADVPDRERDRGSPRELSQSEKHSDNSSVEPRFRIASNAFKGSVASFISSSSWLTSFRDVTRAVDQRTIVAAALPLVATDFTLRIVFFGTKAPTYKPCFLGNLNAFVLDYLARQKLGGIHMSDFITKQLPFIPPEIYPRILCNSQTGSDFVISRVLELTYSTRDIQTFALECGYSGPPFRWDEERRYLLRCELDAAYFHLYLGLPEEWGADSALLREMLSAPRDAVDYIMETFPIVKRKDEQAHGEYRTKRVILEIYDEMAQALRTGQPYQTRLDPLPGPPTDAKGNFIPMDQWDENNWPSHIHRPRGGGDG